MTEPVSMARVEAEIVRLSDAMEDALDDLARRAQTAADAEHAYKVKYAKERLAAVSNGGHGPGGRCTADEAEDRATVRCDAELRARLVSDAYQGVAQERLRTMRSQVEALRTLAANVRSLST